MMKIYDWAKGKREGFQPKDVARVFGLTTDRAHAELCKLRESGQITRRKNPMNKHFRYFAVLPPEEQIFVEPAPRPELFPLIRLPEGTAKALSQPST